MAFTFNIAKGKVGTYAALTSGSDALVLVFLEATGLESDAVLKDYDTLAAVLGGGSVEQTDIGRVTLGNVTFTVDDPTDEARVDCDDFTLIGPTGDPVGAAIVCYVPDTATSTDAEIVPLWKHDTAFTPAGADIPVLVPDDGIWAATD